MAPLPALLPPSGEQVLYSLAVERVPLSEVLYGLAGHADLRLELLTASDTPVSLRAHDRPLPALLDALMAQCGCRYQLSDGVLRVEADTPFHHHYPVDYLNLSRAFHSHLAVATRIGNLSSSLEDAQLGGNRSGAQLLAEGHNDVWSQLERGVRGLLELDEDDSGVRAHPAAGVLGVIATADGHRRVADYLAQVQSRLREQVVIEAVVLEVAFDRERAAAVDWQRVAAGEGVSWAQSMLPGARAIPAEAGGATLRWSHSSGGADTGALLRLLDRHGSVRVLSRPRIVALNNQPSILSVVENKVYFSSKIDRVDTADDGVSRESVDTAIHTVPVGLVLQLVPQIDAGGEVLLSVRPTVSRVSGYVNDPNPELAAVGVVSRVPEIQVREMESLLRVADGETVLLGGMMQWEAGSDQQRVPGLAALPLIGRLFRGDAQSNRRYELLVLLTPRIDRGRDAT